MSATSSQTKGESADTAFTWRDHAVMDFSSVTALGKVTQPLHPLRPTTGGAVVGIFKKKPLDLRQNVTA